MSPSNSVRERIRSPTWQYAILGGLASLPLTIALQLQSPGTAWDAAGIVLCALTAGYLAKRKGLESDQVGLRAGAIGGFPILLSAVDLVPFILGLSQPDWVGAVQLLMLAALIPVVVGVTAVFGSLAGSVGGWLARKQGHPRRSAGI